MSDPFASLEAAIVACGMAAPDRIIADGKLHRFSSSGKRGDDSGWYIAFDDGTPAGRFGDWRSGINEAWKADSERRLSDAERARITRQKAERDREAQQARELAAIKANAIWRASQPAISHPYLTRKGVGAYGVRVYDDVLVVPMRDAGEIHSLQFISAEGEKKFLKGGRAQGLYHPIGSINAPDGVVCVAEGYATGATVYERTQYPVAVAFNAGNLLAVASSLRARYPAARIVICADDDYRTDGNPGITKALEAARAVDGRVLAPDFGLDRPDGATDFNDMAQRAEWKVRMVA